MNTIDALADGDITKWETIMQMRYEKVYLKLLLAKAHNEYQDRYTDIIHKRNQP